MNASSEKKPLSTEHGPQMIEILAAKQELRHASLVHNCPHLARCRSSNLAFSRLFCSDEATIPLLFACRAPFLLI